ncbi:MAG: heat-inducible transcriptional repressor HrcA [bacterium]|nr:heat-inducible transcriptional repressor HrcA [bacterium]
MTRISLEERKQKVLQIVIHHFIRTGKPVGSETIIEKNKLEVSPATVRNILAALEKEGYLTHPHTSSGRVPTDKGYRFYVDSLMQLQQLTQEEEQRIEREYESQRGALDSVMQETSKMLSMLSHYTGFVLTPSPAADHLKRLELVKLDRDRVLAVLVTDAGLIRHKIIDVDQDVNSTELLSINRMLNKNVYGISVNDIGTEIFKRLQQEKSKQVKYISIMEKLVQQAFALDEEGELYLEGTSNILSQPDFADYDKVRNIFKVIDEKKMLCELLEEKVSHEGIKVIIGEETPCKELQECSIVTSTYRAGDKTLGALGIIGPKRMEYSKMIALVNYFSKLINKTLSKTTKEPKREPRKK